VQRCHQRDQGVQGKINPPNHQDQSNFINNLTSIMSNKGEFYKSSRL